MQFIRKTWRFAPSRVTDAEDIARGLSISRIAAQVMINRGMNDSKSGKAFLQPDLGQLHDPGLFPELSPAAGRIRRAIENREKIVVYGDFDVDGISATAILVRGLSVLGANVGFYIPDRLEEGYGLNAEAIRTLAAQNTNLLITVDCGISGAKEVALARELGMDVIVTDHHEPGAIVPSDAILVNPKLPGCSYPFRDLSGAGLAFKLAWSVGKQFASGDRVSPEFREFLVNSLSLAALGTIADVVPLIGENRILAGFGLRGLAASTAPGIMALRDAAGIEGQLLTAHDVAYRLAPRLNAAGRMGSAMRGVELLITDSLPQAHEIAGLLNEENQRRQKCQQQMTEEARELVESSGGADGRVALVLAREGWHAGVVGIVAARMVETYWRPTVILTIEDDVHGSARSTPALHLFDTLVECEKRLTAYGGHARAAGLRMRRSELEAFTEEFQQAAARRVKTADLTPVVDIDAEARLPEIGRPLADEMARLAPFGEGNPEPMLAAFNVEVRSGVKRIGNQGKHLGFWATQDGAALRAVAFGMGELADELTARRRCSIAFTPKINNWRGQSSVELEVKDIQFDDAAD